MSPDHESSYYEIALTNRQVLTIFVVLLTCLVVAFLSGVWIGRRDGGETLAASAGESQTEPATEQMTELNFFSEAPEREERRERTQQPPRPAPPREEPKSETPPPAAAVEEPEPPAAQPPAPRPQQPPAAAGGRVIQVFSTRDAAQADKLVKRLGEGGYPAYLVEESLDSGKTYRVRVGPYRQEAKALQVAEELRRQYRLETWITTQPG